MTRLQERFLDCSQLTIETAEEFGSRLATMQRDVMFWIGDLARYCETRWPNKHQQVWPEWVSPGMLARAAGVCKAYPNQDDRSIPATYTQYMQQAGKPDRLELLAAIIDKGQTSDESAKRESRWLLAIDCNFFIHKFWYSGAGVESAMSVAGWIRRTVDRLATKGLTDVACCFDSKRNARKELTTEWEDKYKDRPPKEPELANQIGLAVDLLKADGFACVTVDGFEGDDLMASYAKQFDGRVTLMTADKDVRQCLSETCNMLIDVTWSESETSGEMMPDYKWMSWKQHVEETGIAPACWPDFQALMGDTVDGIRGCEGIGQKGAADLIQAFGSAAGAIRAAKADDESIRPKKREALIAFEEKLETTLKLVTLVDSLEIPATTRLVN